MRKHSAFRILVALCAVLGSVLTFTTVATPVAAFTSDDFLFPPSWIATGSSHNVTVKEPINAIISARSALGIDPIIYLQDEGWNTCLDSTLQANVKPGGQLTNQGGELRDGACSEFALGGNHLRYWPQKDSHGNTAYFLAISEEHDCLTTTPPFGWHCIDGNGFNKGRDDFVNFVKSKVHAGGIVNLGYLGVEEAQLTSAGTSTDVGGGSAIDHLPYDGKVAILTLAKNTPPPEPGPALSSNLVSDSINGSITLAPGATSAEISATFQNTGNGTWNTNNIFLAAYSKTSNSPVSTAWSSNDAKYYASTNPALIKLPQTCFPSQDCTFRYTIHAPSSYTSGTTLYWRMVEKTQNGGWNWLNNPSGQPALEQYTVKQPSSGGGGGGLSVQFDHDTYNGGSLTSFDLAPGQESGTIIAYFRNTSPSNTLYQNNIYLAAYNYNGDKPGPSSLCDPNWSHAISRNNHCDPTYITLDNACPPGALCSFTYKLLAPGNFSGTTRQNWRVLETHPDGSFAGWLNGPDGSIQTEFYDVVSG